MTLKCKSIDLLSTFARRSVFGDVDLRRQTYTLRIVDAEDKSMIGRELKNLYLINYNDNRAAFAVCEFNSATACACILEFASVWTILSDISSFISDCPELINTEEELRLKNIYEQKTLYKLVDFDYDVDLLNSELRNRMISSGFNFNDIIDDYAYDGENPKCFFHINCLYVIELD